MNYYNEFDAGAAAWLRELVKDKLIPNGEVDDRSICDVKSHELKGYAQCHFFCGIGGWPLALQLAGYPEARSCWTGSCPCQPFSSVGRRLGTKDDRHLWPQFFRLISECRPDVVFGEQVASSAVIGAAGGKPSKKAQGDAGPVWLDGVQDDLESACYAVGANVLAASSVGSPQVRQRLYWVGRYVGGLPDSAGQGLEGAAGQVVQGERPRPLQHGPWDKMAADGSPSHVGRCKGKPCAGAWQETEEAPFIDGESRRVKPGIFPLAPRLPKKMVRGGDQGLPINADATSEGRKARLKGYGNAIVPPLAAVFIRSFLEVESSDWTRLDTVERDMFGYVKASENAT